METVLILLTAQALMGAFDNLYHHEISEKLPSKPSARGELALHTVREYLYAVIFILVGWYQLHGGWAWFLASLLAIEITVTLWDFVIEDQTRRLPKFERILHTVLAINFGVILAFLTPVLWGWGHMPTAMVPVEYGPFSWIMPLFAVGVFLWAVRDMIAVAQLSRHSIPRWQRHPAAKGATENPRTILVTGGTGFIGGHLCRSLIEAGDNLILLSRNRQKAEDMFGPHALAVEDLNELPDRIRIDAIINLAGAPVIGLPWTKARREKLLASRIDTTHKINSLIRRLRVKPEVMISGSAVGYYGNRGDDPLDETAGSQEIFMSLLCRRWEAEAKQAEASGVRVCLLRIGLVLGHDGGALPQLMRPARLGLGAIFGRGRHWQSWIHIMDLVRLIAFLIENREISGPVNATAPEPVRQKKFMKVMGRVLFRPVFLPLPPRLLKFLLGEMADIFVKGQKALPHKAVEQGFSFLYPMLEGALRAVKHAAPKPVRANREPLTLYYNRACPVCAREIAHYRAKAEKHRLPMAFEDINTTPDALRACGLSTDDIKRRLYVADGEGRVHGGPAAFIQIWSRIPGFRWLAVIGQWPGIRTIAALVYEEITVPLFWRRNQQSRGKTAKCDSSICLR